MEKNGKRPPTQRQLRVGEEIRSALAQIFAHGETHNPILDGSSITVSEVRISPDLKNATAYIMPLAGSNREAVMEALVDNAGRLRGMVTRKIILRTSPRISYKLDTSFDEANRINLLLNSERVKADVTKVESSDEL
ncbi:MAG: 30S ribosome-binding factor RbfA [Rickettsiales bacterium]